MTDLYPFQAQAEAEVQMAWQLGARDVCLVMPTGSGKTVTFSHIIREERGGVVAIAHRQEIITQISLSLARNAVRHRLIAPAAVARNCTALHLSELNRNYIDPNATVAVAGVDTLVRLDASLDWLKRIDLVVHDECHHLLERNKWGRARGMFPNARALGVTATPCRADGAGLGRNADGFFDTMVLGPDMRQLIDAGWLSDYRIFAPSSDLDLSRVAVSAGGDFNPKQLAAAVHVSHIVGDVVSQYKKLAYGKRGITFCVDVEEATKQAAAYRAAGVPAEVVTANTPDLMRMSLLRQLREGKLLQLVNVDLFGEGMDIPAIEVVSMARPTESYSLYAQQFGRALRKIEGKTHAIIIDHVRNTLRHGLPDAPRVWSLDRRERRSSTAGSELKLKACPQCTSPYEPFLKRCPWCDYAPEPASRSTIECVAGDLFELDPAVLAKMRGMVDADPKIPYGATPIIAASIAKNHRQKAEAQAALRQSMAEWAGRYSQSSTPDAIAELQRRFFHQFKIDVLSAMALNARDAQILTERLRT